MQTGLLRLKKQLVEGANMTVLTYRGYQASVEYEDGHIVIQLLHIDDCISVSCDNSQDVEAEFHSLVDGYIAKCQELECEPKRPYNGSLNIRSMEMPPYSGGQSYLMMATIFALGYATAWLIHRR